MLLIIAITIPFIGTYSWLTFKKASIKKEVKRELMRSTDSASLVKLGFRLNEIKTKLRWEHSKEFEFEGQMFDIVSKNIEADSIFYLCWPDHKETAVNKKLRKIVSENFSGNRESREKHKRLTDFGSNLFPPLVSESFENNFGSEENFINDEVYYTSIIYEPSPPPPKVT